MPVRFAGYITIDEGGPMDGTGATYTFDGPRTRPADHVVGTSFTIENRSDRPIEVVQLPRGSLQLPDAHWVISWPIGLHPAVRIYHWRGDRNCETVVYDSWFWTGRTKARPGGLRRLLFTIIPARFWKRDHHRRSWRCLGIRVDMVEIMDWGVTKGPL